MHIVYQGAGLKIWAGWESFNHVQREPISKGAGTLVMARHIYGIADSEEDEISLFSDKIWLIYKPYRANMAHG